MAEKGAVPGTNSVAGYVKPAATSFQPVTPSQTMGGVLGQSLQQGGAEVARALTYRKAQDDQTAVNAAMNKFQQHVQGVQYGNPDNPQMPGFLQLQGKAAMDAWGQTSQGINEYRQSLMQGLSPEAQRAFGAQSQQFQTHAFGAMASHVGQQRQAYQRDTLKSSLDIAGNLAVANSDDPEVLSQTMNGGIGKIRGYYAAQGLRSDDPIVQNATRSWTDGTMRDIVLAKTNGGDATGPYNFLESNRSNFSPVTYAQTQERIRPRYEEERADHAYQAVMNTPQAIPDDATPGAVFNAMLHNESRNRQLDDRGNTITSGKGAVGAAQLMPATAREVASKVGINWDENRFRTDGAYNRALGQAYFGQMVQQFSGNLTLACAAYNAGPGQVEKWCKQFGDPRTGGITNDQWLSQVPFKETHAYVGKAGASLTKPDVTPSYQSPDFANKEAELAGFPGLNDREKSIAISKVQRLQSIWNAQTATARADLSRQLDDARAALIHGNTNVTIPEDRIHQLQEPAEAKNTIDTLNILRQGAIEADQYRYASPAEIAQANARDAEQLQGEDVSHYQLRWQVAQQRQAIIKNMQKQMKDDPASYVAQAPSLAGARSALQQAEASGDRTAIQTAQAELTRQSMDLQQHIAPNQRPRMLSNAQVEQIGQGIAQIDPAKEDILGHLKNLEDHYGESWHQALEELVQQGKMPPDYMIAASMSHPSQTYGRSMFTRSLGTTFDNLEKQVPQAVATEIRGTRDNNPIDDALSSFHQTLKDQDGGGALYQQIKQAVHRQALNYASHGQNAEQAVTAAVNDIVGQYDTSGTIRAPKGELGAVQTATAWKLQNLSSHDIMPPSSGLNLSDEDRADYGLARARSLGRWVMNDNETGYNLVVPTRSLAQNWIVRNPDGTPLTLTLKDIRSGALIPVEGPGANSIAAGNMRYYQQQANAAQKADPDLLSEDR